MVLRIDKVVTQETPASSDQPGVISSLKRYYVTDGRLYIQALLKPSLAASYDLKAGDLVEVRDFEIRKAKRLNGDGKVIYLGIQELEILDRDTNKESDEAGGFIRTDDTDIAATASSRKRRKLKHDRVTFADLPGENKEIFTMMEHPGETKKKYTSHRTQSYELEETDSDDGFESQDVDIDAVEQRRQTLQNIKALESPRVHINDYETSNEAFESEADPGERDPASTTPTKPNGHSSLNITIPNNTKSQAMPPTHPRDCPPALTPPYHTLASLLDPTLPSKNYPLSTLAIITYISPTLLCRPHSPFPPKRHIKLLDPSLAALSTTRYDSFSDSHQTVSRYPQGITLAVYCDAAKFLPKQGTIALFRGIVMQKFGGEVILNAYASLKEKGEGGGVVCG